VRIAEQRRFIGRDQPPDVAPAGVIQQLLDHRSGRYGLNPLAAFLLKAEVFGLEAPGHRRTVRNGHLENRVAQDFGRKRSEHDRHAAARERLIFQPAGFKLQNLRGRLCNGKKSQQ